MLAVFDIILSCCKVFLSCVFNREKCPNRSWRGEFVCRLAKGLLTRSIGKKFDWIRARQNVLTLYSPDLFKVNVERVQIQAVDCLVLQPKKRPNPDKVIVYFHGGGYAVGSAEGYRLMGAKLALQCQAKVVLVDYRLVPDFALPAAQDDCYAVTQNIVEKHTHKQVILMGDSAGGALCLTMLKRLKATTGKPGYLSNLAACVLISPWVAPLSFQNLSLENEKSDMLDRHITQYWVDTFCQSEADRKEVDFSDIQTIGLAEDEWPPTYIQAAGAEVFLTQVQRLSEQLTQSGIHHKFDVYPDQFHVFQTFSPLVPEANDALADIANYVASI